MTRLGKLAIPIGLLLALVAAASVVYAMGGGHHGGGDRGYGPSWGHMGPGWHRDPMGGSHHYGAMNDFRARGMFANCLGTYYSGNYRMAPMTDHGAYYESHVLDSNGEAVERMTVDKRSGELHREPLSGQ